MNLETRLYLYLNRAVYCCLYTDFTTSLVLKTQVLLKLWCHLCYVRMPSRCMRLPSCLGNNPDLKGNP